MADGVEVSSKNSLKRFRWETETVSQLIDCLLEYKTKMAYRNLDFDADKQIQYQELRVEMAKLHVDSEYMFGPVVAVKLPDDFETRSKEEKAKAKHDVKESKDMIRKGQKRVMEKVKEIRQSFSKAVVSGSRSGSGKIVYEFYDKLITLWGGSAGTEPLSYGVGGDDFQEDNEVIQCHNPEDDNLSMLSFDSETPSTSAGLSDLGPEDNGANESENVAPNNKRKANCVPKLIDNKRKHLEKRLSAAQRDELLIKEAKEDAQFRKDLAEAMRESTASFSQSIESVSKAMTDLGAGVCRSIEMLSQALQQPYAVARAPVNQDLFYQNPMQVAPQAAENVYAQLFTSHNHQDPGSSGNFYYQP